MKKSTKILSFILIVLLIILGKCVLIKNNQTTTLLLKDKEFKMNEPGSGTGNRTKYYDFSALNELDTQYAYSSLKYTANTRFMLLNKNQSGFKANVNSGTGKADGNISVYFGDIENNDGTITKTNTKSDTEVKILITNCATNSQNEDLDVIITLSKYRTYRHKNKATDRDNSVQGGISFSIASGIIIENQQEKPISIIRYKKDNETDDHCGTSQKVDPRKINSPISFKLNAEGAEILYSMTYYKHPNNYINTGKNATYNIDISKLTPDSTIRKVNGFYYDIDIVTNTDFDNKLDNKPSIFTGDKCKFEGINPYLGEKESAQIYYNRGEGKNHVGNYATYKRSKLKGDDREKSVRLGENNGGIRVDDVSHKGDAGSKVDGYTLSGEYNVNSAWYGQSAFMTNTINNSTMRFMYGGNGCGIWYSFMAPVPYKYSSPTKKVANATPKIGQYGDSTSINEGDKVAFSIEQFIPDNATVTDLKFNQKYNTTGCAYMKKTKIKTLQFCDDIGTKDEFTINKKDIKVYEGANDVTNKFSIEIDDASNPNYNRIKVTGRGNYVYNTKYKVVILATYNKLTDDNSIRRVHEVRTIKVNDKDTKVIYNLNGNPDNDGIRYKTLDRYVKSVGHDGCLYIENNEFMYKNIAKTNIKLEGENDPTTRWTGIVNVKLNPGVHINVEKTANKSKINDLEEEITYTIKYTAKIVRHIGNVDFTVTDEFPYNMQVVSDGATSGDLNLTENGSNAKKRVWKGSSGNVVTLQNNDKNGNASLGSIYGGYIYLKPITKTWEKTFTVKYTNMDIEADRKFTNNVNVEAKTSYNTATANASCSTNQEFVIDIDVTKLWDDTTHRRPVDVKFMLVQNGNTKVKKYDGTEETIINDVVNDKTSYLKLPKYKVKGSTDVVTDAKSYPNKVANNKIEDCPYTLKEITKMTNKNGRQIVYSLDEITGELIQGEDDLSYYMNEDATQNNRLTTKAQIEDNKTPGRWEDEKKDGRKKLYIKFINRYSSINIKGNVWKDTVIDGIKSNESGFKGVEVKLYYLTYNINTNEVHNIYYGETQRTNENGDFEFIDIPWNGSYKIAFTYNGQVYESTYYKNDIKSGKYSNIKDINETLNPERQNVNDRFATISAYPNNYENNKRAFGLKEKIKNADNNDANYNYQLGETPYTFEDVLKIFENVDLNINQYGDAFWSKFESDLVNEGIKASTATKIKEYVQDSMTHASTQVSYSANDLNEKLKPGEHKTVELVTAGLARRETNDLSITNDVYKVTSIIDGKITEDKYNTKQEIYEVTQRKGNELYNGSQTLERKLYKSDYLFSGEDINEDNSRNLRVYVTYRIRIKNKGRVSAIINSITDYYDTNNFETIASIGELNTFKDNTFIGDSNYNKVGELGIEDLGETLGDGHKYSKIMLTGVDSTNPSRKLPIRVRKVEGNEEAAENYILHPEEETDVYITFKVKNDAITNRVPIDKEIKNIAEINGYTTLYTPQDNTVIPDVLAENDNKEKKKIEKIVNAGLVDIDSDPGSLLAQDLDENDNLIYEKTQANKTYENMEDDTDKIGIKLAIAQDLSYNRYVSGNVFEDIRNQKQSSITTTIGNGYIEEGEKGIKGVTAQLVQLVPEIDADGLETGKYVKEIVLGSYVYSRTEEGGLLKTSDNTNDANDNSYYSGSGKSKVVETGTGELEVKSTDIGTEAGEYRFDSMYPGDFYVRFIYGDSERTVLTNGENEVNTLLKDTNLKGLNEKSYNGQDYKSTIYQSGFNNSGHIVSVDQSGSYNGIDGYTRYDTQNFSATTNVNDKGSMYYYDLEKSNNIKINNKKVRVSDAKDIYDDRIQVTLYSTDLINSNSEVLNSFNRLGSKIGNTQTENVTEQEKLIEELINKTKMRANTGIIQVECKHDNNTTKEVDLGLVERAKAQTKLTKEIKRIQITLANGEVLFNTTKSVNNLFFSEHTEHGVKYENYRIKENPTINKKKGESTAELLQIYMDKELIDGAIMQVDYKMNIKNVGEIDYKDKKYYYTGIEDDKDNNIAKTKINKIIDYNSNDTTYEEGRQKEGNTWKVVGHDYLLENKYVSGRNEDELKTYETLLVNDGVGKELAPEMFNENESEISTELTMSTFLNSGNIMDTLVYNNTLEIIELTSEIGRREQYSIPGNQAITNQTLSRNAVSGESVSDRRTPAEIDADSAQRIVIMPPTGQRDYTSIIFAINIGLGVILIGAFVIRELLFKTNESK